MNQRDGKVQVIRFGELSAAGPSESVCLVSETVQKEVSEEYQVQHQNFNSFRDMVRPLHGGILVIALNSHNP